MNRIYQKFFRARKIIACALATAVLFGSFGVSAALAWVPGQPLVPPCGGTVTPYTGSQGSFTDYCDWPDFILLIANLTQFLLFLAVFAATLMFAWAGFLMVTAQGNPGQVTRAKSMFWTAGIGLVLMASAWLIIQVIINTLGAQNTAGRYLGIF